LQVVCVCVLVFVCVYMCTIVLTYGATLR